MEHFVINCPWCRDDSRFEVDDLSKACVPPIYATDDADSVLDEVEKRYPVFQCLQHDCLAPFEALICRGLRTAKTVQQAASRVAWTPPRRFRLRKTAHGELYQDVYGVLFNRKPLTRWKEIRLSSLLEVPIIAKFLSAHAWRFGSPVTLFEAWASDFEDKIYWIPVQPMGPPASPGPVRIGTSPQYRETCRVCRNVFEQAAIDALRFSSRLKRNCPSFDDCPAQRACLSEPWAQPNISDRCLRWLELRELDNPCWQSDLKIIGDMVTKFEKEKVWATKPFAPHEATCWAGYMEMAFPVIVHDHLAGALMIGQFGTDQSPQDEDAFVEKERRWRDLNRGSRRSLPLLGEHLMDLEHALQRVGYPGGMVYQPEKHELTPDAAADIKEDIEYLARLTVERYLRHRDLAEATFRLELAGTMTLWQLRRDDFKDFLPGLLKRMRDFWAFEHVCLCMMGDWEDCPTLYATDHRFYPHPEPIEEIPDFVAGVAEYGARDILLGSGAPPIAEADQWHNFVDQLAGQALETSGAAERQSLLVVVRAASRSYIFCFFGREAARLSRLPRGRGDGIYLSRECREQVTRTCEQAARHLHNFWARYDQELAYRVLSHSLRTPVTLMKKGAGTSRRLLDIHKDSLRRRYPKLLNSVTELFESLRIGSEIVDDQLKTLGAAANLEAFLERARKGETDLVSLLARIEPQCKWRSRIRSDSIVRPPTWDFDVSGVATVRGDADAIGLVIWNVLDNAFKYSFPGRLIRVEVARTCDGCQLVVTNQGVPVEERELHLVWQKDYRGINARKRIAKAEEGTGYGLFIVKQIVEASGGTVSMQTKILSQGESREGQTTVTLLFRKGN